MNIQNTLNATAQAALEYAARGWHVFPVPPGTKKSHKSAEHSKGRKWGATIDPDEIRADWSQWPLANIGIVTGPDSGFFVIDADTMDGHGSDGLGAIKAWRAEHGDFPHTIEATTPSGGQHCYFRYPDALTIQTNSNKLAPGIDVRGAGGMVLAPPSVKPDGTVYKWSNPPGFFDLADAPQWLLDRIEQAQRPKLSERTAAPDFSAMNTPTGLDEVADLLDYIDPDAGGYDQWFKILMALHDYAGGSGEGLALAEHWSQRGSKYKPGEVVAKWQTFRPGMGVGKGTIAALARDYGADLSAIARQHKGRPTIEIHKTVTATSYGTPRPNAPDDLDLSHDGLASDMGARSWDCDARHVASRSKWFFWTGTHWQVDERLDHMTRTRAYLRDRADELEQRAKRRAEEGDQNAAKLETWAKDRGRTLRHKNTVAAVESLARSNPASVAAPNDFDRDRLLLGTPGGTVDLRTGELRAAQRKDMVTKQTAIAPAPQGSTPHLWLQFLSEIFAGDSEIIAFMQRVAGYALTGMTTEHKLLFFYGTGRNGKSVFLNVLFDIWGDYARRASSATFLNSQNERHPTDLAGLQGARLVAGSELPRGKTWDESVIKDLTGGDTMTARFMRGDFFDFEPQLTLMIAGNNQPSFRGVDEAIRARVVLVPFTVTIPPEKRDKGLPDKLRAEGPQILRWAIDGALQWQERGLDVPASVEAASAEYFDDEDTLAQFLADETEQDATAFVTSTDLHQRFVQWTEGQGLNSWTLRTLQKELKSRGFHDLRRNHGRGFAGIKLK
jgi:P4 family phage/plasmid primase-like protien